MEFEEDIRGCIAALKVGGTIVYPTDTIWGIGCDATNEAAVNAVFELKQRPQNKSLIILVADARDILHFVAAPPPDIIDIVSGFVTPTTVIYDSALDLPDNLVNADGSIGIRVATDPFCKALIKRFRKPIVSTSANISGMPSPAFFKDIDIRVLRDADYVVNHRREDTITRSPSRIARVDDDGTLSYIR